MLDNREKSFVIWLSFVLVLCLLNKKIRESIFSLMKAFLQSKIIYAFLLVLIYSFTLIVLFYKSSFWYPAMLKDSIVWFLGAGIVMWIGSPAVSKDKDAIKKLLISNLKIGIILEFLISLYPFPFWTEIILIPLLFFCISISVVADADPKNKPAKVLADRILKIIGLVFFVQLAIHIFINFQDFISLENLKTFFFPLLLTFLFIPMVYIFALYGRYEVYFVTLNFLFRKNPSLSRFIKKKVIFTCFFSLKKLNNFIENYHPLLMPASNQEEVINIINSFKKSFGQV